MKDFPEISLCMIARNSKDTIKSSLQSVKDVVSEMIVVDTGSEDNTIDIAKKEGAEVFEFEWIDDFSAARNFSISKAKGQWILILDTDETIDEKNKDKIRNLDFNNNVAFYLNLKSKINTESSFNYVINSHPRLFKNNIGIKFEGKVHEQIIKSVNKINKTIIHTNVYINHYGYNVDNKILDNKLKRNIKLLEIQASGDNDSAIDYFHLGETYSMLFKWDKAIIYYKKALYNGDLPRENRAIAHQNLGTAYLNINRFTESIEEERLSLKLNPKLSAPHLVIAQTSFLSRNYDLTIREIKRYLEKIEKRADSGLLIDLEPDLKFVYTLLGDAYFESGNFNKAEKCYIKLKNYSDIDYNSRLSLLYLNSGEVEKGQRFLNKFLELKKINDRAIVTLIKYAEFYIKNNEFKRARTIIDVVLDKEKKNKYALYLYALSLIEEKKFSSAEDYLEKIINLFQGDLDILYLLANVYFMRGKNRKALDIYRKILKERPYSKELLSNTALSYLRIGDMVRAEEMYKEILNIYPDDTEAMKKLVGIYGKIGKIKEAELILNELKKY